MATAPQTTPYNRYRIRESRRLLFVPGGSANRLDLGLDQPVSHQRNHREQSEKYRRRPSNRQIVPLPLRFYSQTRTGLFACRFHPPASHEPIQNPQRRMLEIGRQQRLRLKLAEGIADQHPTNRGWHIPAAIPDGLLKMISIVQLLKLNFLSPDYSTLSRLRLGDYEVSGEIVVA